MRIIRYIKRKIYYRKLKKGKVNSMFVNYKPLIEHLEKKVMEAKESGKDIKI